MNLRKRTIAAITAGAAALGGIGGYVTPDANDAKVVRLEAALERAAGEALDAREYANDLEELNAEAERDRQEEMELLLEDRNETLSEIEILQAEIDRLRARLEEMQP